MNVFGKNKFDRPEHLYSMYVLQVAETPVGDYAPIGAKLVKATSFWEVDWDNEPYFDEYGWDTQVGGGVDPLLHDYKLASPLPAGRYFWREGDQMRVTVYQP